MDITIEEYNIKSEQKSTGRKTNNGMQPVSIKSLMEGRYSNRSLQPADRSAKSQISNSDDALPWQCRDLNPQYKLPSKNPLIMEIIRKNACFIPGSLENKEGLRACSACNLARFVKSPDDLSKLSMALFDDALLYKDPSRPDLQGQSTLIEVMVDQYDELIEIEKQLVDELPFETAFEIIANIVRILRRGPQSCIEFSQNANGLFTSHRIYYGNDNISEEGRFWLIPNAKWDIHEHRRFLKYLIEHLILFAMYPFQMVPLLDIHQSEES